MGRLGDAEGKEECLQEEPGPGGGEWAARGDGLGWPRRLWQEREEGWGKQKSLLHHPATLAIFLFLHCLQVYHSLSPLQRGRVDTTSSST